MGHIINMGHTINIPINTHLFCEKCGTKLIKSKIPSELCYYYDWGDRLPYNPYCKETGKKLFMLHFKCPNSTDWFNKHDNFDFGQPFTK